MLTAIVSDLHLGTRSGADVARLPALRERLLEALARADRVVLLGDLLELRERRAGDVLEAAAPLLDGLGEASAGKQVVIVPGNHDHQLVEPGIERARLAGAAPLASEASFAPEGELIRSVAARMPGTEVVLAYPGIRLRDDVYATHGHYLDVHLTVPRLECVIASAVARLVGGPRSGRPATPESYEAALAPIYAFAYNVVQNADTRAITRGGKLSRRVWSLSNPHGRRSLAGLALGRLAIPVGVRAINALGLGPFGTDISGSALRSAGLRAIADVIASLGIEARHVIFGHTHRAGPLPGESEGWELPGGLRLTNTGSWLYERVFIGSDGAASPYFPGRVTLLRDDGPPELTNVLSGLDLERELGARARRAPGA